MKGGITKPHQRTSSMVQQAQSQHPASSSSSSANSAGTGDVYHTQAGLPPLHGTTTSQSSANPNRIREWTFPKSPAASPNPNASSPLIGSSPSLSSSTRSLTNPNAAPPSNDYAEPKRSFPLSTTPRAAAKAKRGPADYAYGLVFILCLYFFFSALTGHGYQAPVPSLTPEGVSAPPKPVDAMKRSPATQDEPERPAPKWVVVKDDSSEDDGADTYELQREEVEDEEMPADVHNAQGDSSHDVGHDWVKDSPDDPALDAEHADQHPANHARPLFHAHGSEDTVIPDQGQKKQEHHAEEAKRAQKWAAAAGVEPKKAGAIADAQDEEESFVIGSDKQNQQAFGDKIDPYDGARPATDVPDPSKEVPYEDEGEDTEEEDDDDDEDEDDTTGDFSTEGEAAPARAGHTHSDPDSASKPSDNPDENEDDDELDDPEDDEEDDQDAIDEEDLEDVKASSPEIEELGKAKAELVRRKKEREDQRARWVANVRQARDGAKGAAKGREMR